MEVNHVQGGRKIRLSQPQQLMAQDRKIVEEAYAGDIIGVFDPGIFSIGDTLCAPGRQGAVRREFLPSRRSISPECAKMDTMKRKQFIKGNQPDCPGGRNPEFSRSSILEWRRSS